MLLRFPLPYNSNPVWSFQPTFAEEQHHQPKDLISEDEIFLAKPIIVEDLSIDSRDGYSFENGEDGEEEEETSSPNTSSNPPASLSLSEDSDTARIYDLHTMETRFEKRPQPPPQTVLSPDTLKFFAPKTVPNFSNRVSVESVEKAEMEVRIMIIYLPLLSLRFKRERQS